MRNRLLIRRRSVWASAAALLVGLGAVVAALLLSMWLLRAADNRALARADLVADVVLQQGLHTVATIDGLLSQVQLCRRLRLDGQEDAASTVEGQLRDSARRAGIGVIDVALGDAAGAVQWSALNQPEPEAIAGEPAFAALRDGTRGLEVSGVTVDAATGRQEVRFLRPLPDVAGHFAGFAMVAVDPAMLSAHFAALHFDIAAVPLLARLQDGAVIAHGGELAPPDAAPPVLDAATLASLRAAPSGSLRGRSPLNGRDSFAGFHTLDSGGLVVLAELSASEQLAPERWQARIIQVAAGLVVLLCAVALAGALAVQHREQIRKTLAAAEAARAELETLLAGLPVAAYQGRLAQDGDYTRRYLSPNIEAITGWTPAELATPADWAARMEDAASFSFPAFFRSVLHDGTGTVEYRLRRPDGGATWLSETARVAVRLPDGGAEVVGTIADVTVERELAAQAAMTSKLSMLGEMASGMAHELIQPITAISLAAELATAKLDRAPAESANIARALDTVARESRRAGEIIDQLRLFGRADQGPPGPVRLDAAVRGALTLVAGPLRDASVDVVLDIPPGLPPVLGRLVPIEQVFVNLCMNARDAMVARGVGGRRLTIGAALEGDLLRVRIADTGGGLAPTVLARLFEPFVTTKPAGAGTGLGLSICLRLMRGFSGDIAARNTDDGAEFLLTFLAAPADVAAAVNPGHAE